MADQYEKKLVVKREITIEELYDLMQMYWDTEQQGPFILDYRNPFSEERCIFLPATKRFMVMVCPSESGVFHKQYEVLLSVTETPAGMEEELKRSFPTSSLLFGAFKIGKLASIQKEKSEQAAEKLSEYAQGMKRLLDSAGLSG